MRLPKDGASFSIVVDAFGIGNQGHSARQTTGLGKPIR
jgi:hypothetical protein